MGQRCIRYSQRRMRINNVFGEKATDRQRSEKEQTPSQAGKGKFQERQTLIPARPSVAAALGYSSDGEIARRRQITLLCKSTGKRNKTRRHTRRRNERSKII